MVPSTELNQLKELQKKLKAIDACEANIQDAKQDKNAAENFSPKDVKLYSKRDTNNEAKYVADLKKVKGEKATKITMIIAAITIVAMVTIFVLNIVGQISRKGYIYTPEIVKEYKGIYYHDTYWNEAKGYQEHVLSITSCSKNGQITGTFKVYLNGEILGGYSFSGLIRGKRTDGYLEAQVQNVSWTTQPEQDAYLPDKIQTIIISDNFTKAKAIFSKENSFTKACELYSADVMTTVSDFETPEIVRSYAGDFKSGMNIVLGAVTITSCDAEGKITGTFEYDYNNKYGKFAIEGQITEKYSNGILFLTIKSGKWIVQPQYTTNPLFDEITVVILNDYTKFRCAEMSMLLRADLTLEDKKNGVKYEENNAKNESSSENNDETTKELLKQTPLTDEQKQMKSLMTWVFWLLPVFGLVLAWIIGKKIKSLTAEEKKTRDDLRAKDEEAKADNDRRYKQLVEEKRTQARSSAKYYADKIATSQKALAELEAEVAEFDVLGPKEKNLRAVNYIIDVIESRRADSIKEALNMYDAYVIEHDRRVLEEGRRRQEEIVRKYQAQQELEDYWAQQRHNYKLQKEAERQTDELKRIRKELEDRR